jgi:hypothetical protein
MTAGVHATRVSRTVRKAVAFQDGQGIHIGAKTDAAMAGSGP